MLVRSSASFGTFFKYLGQIVHFECREESFKIYLFGHDGTVCLVIIKEKCARCLQLLPCR